MILKLGTQALQNLLKWWTRVDRDLIYDKVKFCGPEWGKLSHLIGENFQQKTFTEYCNSVYEKYLMQGIARPCPGTICMFVSIIFKHF